MTAVVGLTIGGPCDPWAAIGLRVVDELSWVGGVRLTFDVAAPPGLLSWTLTGSPTSSSDIGGLRTAYDDEVQPLAWSHELGSTSIDDLHHVAGSLGPAVISLPKAAVQAGRSIASFDESASGCRSR